MTESTQRFIAELIQAGNEVEKLTALERADLLRRAAVTIRDYRDQIKFSEPPENASEPGDIVFDLNEMARTIDTISAADVSEALLDSADTIRAELILLDAKGEIDEP